MINYRLHKSPPLNVVLSQLNMFHVITSYFFKIHLNIIPIHRGSSLKPCATFRNMLGLLALRRVQIKAEKYEFTINVASK